MLSNRRVYLKVKRKFLKNPENSHNDNNSGN